MSCSNFHFSVSPALSRTRTYLFRSTIDIFFCIFITSICNNIMYILFFLPVRFYLLLVRSFLSFSHSLTPCVHTFIWSFRRFILYTLRKFALKNLEKNMRNDVDHSAGHIIFIRKLLFFDDFDGNDKDVTVRRWMLKQLPKSLLCMHRHTYSTWIKWVHRERIFFLHFIFAFCLLSLYAHS